MRRNLKGVRSEKTEESEKEKCLMKIEFSVEMLLSKFFVGKKSTTAKEAMLYVKGMMQGEGVRKSEIREARKRLSIGTEKVTEGYVWSWENPIDPEIMWKIKSEEFMT